MLEQQIPRLKLMTESTAVDPDLPGINKLPRSTRVILGMMKLIPALR